MQLRYSHVRVAILLEILFVATFSSKVSVFNDEESNGNSVDKMLEDEQLIHIKRHRRVIQQLPATDMLEQLMSNLTSTQLGSAKWRAEITSGHYQDPQHPVSSQVQVHPNKNLSRSFRNPSFTWRGNFSDSNKLLHPARSRPNIPAPSVWEELTHWGGEEEDFDDLQPREVVPLGELRSGGLSQRHKRAVSSPGSGDVVAVMEARLNGSLTTNQQLEGSPEKDNLKADIQKELEIYLKTWPNLKKVAIDVEVTLVSPPEISFTAELHSSETEDYKVELARALHQLDLRDNFKIHGSVHSVSDIYLSLSSSAKEMKAVICYLCRAYQTCRQEGTTEWVCRISDTSLFPYGSEADDKVLPADEEFASAKVEIETLLPFGDKLVSSIYISINGLISFEEEFTSFSPEQLPIYNSATQTNRSLLCPYWSDLDETSSDQGRVFYQHYQRGKITSNDQQNVLERANREVEQETHKGFNTSSLVVATWYEMAPSPAQDNDDERVTFQAVIITDGETTYVMFLYAQEAMNFNHVLGRDVVVGFAGTNLDSSKENYYSFDRIPGNTGKYGHWFFKVGYKSNSRAKCLEWYQSNIIQLEEIHIRNGMIPACPCSEMSARVSFLWIPSKLQSNCYEVYPVYDHYGRRCCYRSNDSSSFENRIPAAGSFQSFTPFSDPVNHELYDASPKRWCCEESDLCSLYYTVRPAGDCKPVTQTVTGVMFGDPHITTLDSKTFTFNGLGEYHLLEASGYSTAANKNLNYMLQGRTCRSQNSDGEWSNATSFCTLAANNSNGGSLTVDVSSDKKYMVIYANNQDFTVAFRDTADFSVKHGDIFLHKVDSTLKVSTPDDIGLSVSLRDGILDFSVEISTSYRQLTNGTKGTKGLLGNFNEDSRDDFIFPNGTLLSHDVSERELYEYGQTWAVAKHNSILPKVQGRSILSYNDITYEPVFFDDLKNNSSMWLQAQNVCGSSSDHACIYDYLVTKNDTLAKGTKDANETFHDNKGRAANQPPVIKNLATKLDVTVNQDVNINITAEDPENNSIEYYLINKPTSGFTYNILNNMLIASYKPVDINQEAIIITAVDTPWNQSSNVLQFQISKCSGCNNHGTCNFDRSLQITDPYFSIASCDCESPWSGNHCENDTDGCANKPCPVGTNCTDIPAAEEKRTGKTYNCSPCPMGFVLNGSKCEDINECVNIVSPCGTHANCTNKYGSYSCQCHDGYWMNENGLCKDIDECARRLHTCDQICLNTDGAYLCLCNEGFEFKNSTCIPKTHTCELNHNCDYQCRVTSGKSECFCRLGFKLSSDGFSCEDINECSNKESGCSQNCTNKVGGFECFCFSGYRLLEDGKTCQECPKNKYGVECQNTCSCRGREVRCDKTSGCVCREGWEGSNCEIDVNECVTKLNPCPVGKNCINAPGEYVCNCPDGFQDKFENDNCININECEDVTAHRCPENSHCMDNIGSFTCPCDAGYSYVNGTASCSDINECHLGISGCEQDCENTAGSFNCKCKNGYYLDFDRKTCLISDEGHCRKLQNCSDGCEADQNGEETCFCNIGYILSNDNFTCIDIDECKSTLTNPCSHNCSNTDGSYNCSCPVGWQLQNDLRTCKACDGKHWGPSCVNKCDCNPLGMKTCDHITGCVCESGWSGPTCYQDVNECQNATSPCPAHTNCNNTHGSYKCVCPGGSLLTNNSNTCPDVCEQKSPCEQICHNTNTIDGFECSCQNGFSLSSNKRSCIDKDECSLKEANCEQLCINNYGSYTCGCQEGFLLNVTTMSTCYSCDDIHWGHNCLMNCICVMANTEECNDTTGQCHCKEGWEGSSCDICGSDECQCPKGTYRLNAGEPCQACDDIHWGHNCLENCICVMANTEDCNDTTGQCHCKEGWEGSSCDICGSDECQCPKGTYRLNAGEPCQGNIVPFEVEVELMFNTEVNQDVFKADTPDFKEFAKNIEESLLNFGRSINDYTLVAVKVTSMRQGSVIASASLFMDLQSANPEGAAARFIKELARNNSLLVNGQSVSLRKVTVSGKEVTNETSYCEMIEESIQCLGKKCKEDIPQCVAIPIKSNLDLYIGLSVGIFGFLLLLIAAAILAFTYRKRKAKSQEEPTQASSADFAAPFRSGFAVRGQMFRTLGPLEKYYQPFNSSEAGTSAADSQIENKDRDRFALPNQLWYYNGAVRKANDHYLEEIGDSSRGTEPPSNFSWDRMFTLLEPHKHFEIQRPNINLSGNPTYGVEEQSEFSS